MKPNWPVRFLPNSMKPGPTRSMASRSQRSISTIRQVPVRLIAHSPGLADLDAGLEVRLALRHADDPHPPPGMGGEETAELLPREVMLVDVDDRLTGRPRIVDHAPKHVAPRDPLASPARVFDLGLPGGTSMATCSYPSRS